MKIHLDTDIGGDTDDLCALALLLASPEVDLVGITTVADRGGSRAAFVHHALLLARRTDVPVASGAFDFLGGMAHKPGLPDERFWPGLQPVPPTPPGEAINLLATNAVAGATVVAIGPYTNLAVLESLRPGLLRDTRLVVMGGLVRAMPEGVPQWDACVDYNVQADRVAARIVFERLSPVIVPIEVSVRTWVRGVDLPRLRSGGPLARLAADQSELYAACEQRDETAPAYPGLPADLLNWQHDPLACAVAMNWDCVEVTKIPLVVGERGELLVLREEANGRPCKVATGVNSERFAERWLDTVLQI